MSIASIKAHADSIKAEVDALSTAPWPAGTDCLGTTPTLPAFTPGSGWSFVMTSHTRMDSELRAGWIAYIGSSVTAETDVTQTHPACVNLGIGGDTMAGVLNRLGSYPALHRAGAVILEIGINDAGYTAWADMDAQLSKLYGWFTGPLVVLSLIPQGNGALSLANLSAVNNMMASKLSGRSRCVLVDITTPLQDADGFMKPSYSLDTTREHPNTAGKAIIRSAVQTALGAVL